MTHWHGPRAYREYMRIWVSTAITTVVVVLFGAASFATDGFGMFPHEYDLRTEITGTGKAARIDLTWPGQVESKPSSGDLPWSARARTGFGFFTLLATGVPEDATCRLLVDGREVVRSTVRGGELSCEYSVQDEKDAR
ncbi:hypothetical protein KALB_1180 [Kutzneria albida DSM 43870]|uniref:Uncharacterized protein n=2 Tax=Kutzneria TaxID=43356 RepID=W5W031_9PSEU|nr:hypothetical protein KALB_1180 [Kutzneria albida DSM 43870]